MRDLLDRLLAGTAPDAQPLTHVEELPARAATTVRWPAWVPDVVRSRMAENGIAAPWAHQAAAADAAHGGRSVVLATGTASGKSLAYQLPGLTALVADDHARVLYLAPTKALAGDQLRALTALAVPGLRAATYDGDTPFDERDWVRAHANWVLTNPDMLHLGVLPAHSRWAPFFRRLRYVVIDECHAYRGLFGSHAAQILRRLRRVCASYGTAPTFVLASATVASPAESAARLIGLPVTAVTDDGSPHGATVFGLWEPPLTALRGEHDAPVRRSAGAEAGSAAGGSRRRGCPDADVRAIAPRRRADRAGRAAAAGRGRTA